jgi:hypothetical protein
MVRHLLSILVLQAVAIVMLVSTLLVVTLTVLLVHGVSSPERVHLNVLCVLKVSTPAVVPRNVSIVLLELTQNKRALMFVLLVMLELPPWAKRVLPNVPLVCLVNMAPPRECRNVCIV